jgi:hypothetical protein
MKFYVGLHHPSEAWPFERSMISVLALRGRKRNFRVNDWILDSGAFSQINAKGKFIMSPGQYASQIQRWARCGNLVGAVCQDWMCEPFILERTRKTIREHQELTTESYAQLSLRCPEIYILPVLQGYSARDYTEHINWYGKLLLPGAWVGIGSVCKRNARPGVIEDILVAIKSVRPDLRLHGFGVKLSALKNGTVRSLLESSDSMAWSVANRRAGHQNDPRRALAYQKRVERMLAQPAYVQMRLW